MTLMKAKAEKANKRKEKCKNRKIFESLKNTRIVFTMLID